MSNNLDLRSERCGRNVDVECDLTTIRAYSACSDIITITQKPQPVSCMAWPVNYIYYDVRLLLSPMSLPILCPSKTLSQCLHDGSTLELAHVDTNVSATAKTRLGLSGNCLFDSLYWMVHAYVEYCW